MSKEVIITVISKQKADGDEESLELVTLGKFYRKAETYYIVYEETRISGMEGTTTTLRIENENVSLTRFGTINSTLKFSNGYEDISLYKTPHGVLELTVKTLRIQVDVGDNGGEVMLVYELKVEGLKTSINELFIKIQ